MRKPGSSRRRYVLVFNATTLIVLRELGRMDMVEAIRRLGYVSIVIPRGVRNEFLRAGIGVAIPSNNIFDDEELMEDLLLDIPRSLGEGERHAIAIAYSLTQRLGQDTVVVVVTDDKRARSKCRELGVKVFGTLGLIEFAKKHGIISKEEALKLLDLLPDTSLYVTEELLGEARARIRQQDI
ncbi:MAG: hypothetical protein GSR72_00185 [Desulfurococcales archaeon]|nr:hypothetical protein [Desulfurococcales archaeon]